VKKMHRQVLRQASQLSLEERSVDLARKRHMVRL
jgi:hypothetical protein